MAGKLWGKNPAVEASRLVIPLTFSFIDEEVKSPGDCVVGAFVHDTGGSKSVRALAYGASRLWHGL